MRQAGLPPKGAALFSALRPMRMQRRCVAVLIDNEKRTIIATKSPDDLTDATFDLTVKVMDNAGQQYSKVVTVTVNRTMGESAYDKQEKPLTKLTDTLG